jgi:hypothetical protein
MDKSRMENNYKKKTIIETIVKEKIKLSIQFIQLRRLFQLLNV